MNAFSRLLGGAVIGLVLAAGLAAPAVAQKLDNKNGPTTTATTATPNADIDFGDDSSEWANDGECDDPRFEGTGSAGATSSSGMTCGFRLSDSLRVAASARVFAVEAYLSAFCASSMALSY